PGLRDRRLAMIALTRAGWLASAALFGLFLASILHTHFAGPVPFAVLTGVAILSAIRPARALPGGTALLPGPRCGARQRWPGQGGWAEGRAGGALAGVALDACRGGPAVPRALAAPAAVFGAIVMASLAASLRVLALRGGPAFWPVLTTTVSRSYFTDRSLTSVLAGLLLLEGTLLFAHAARLGT